MFAQVKGQEEQRRPEMFVDRHGREYFANVELKTGDPCEVLQPRFRSPIAPEWARKMLLPPVDDHEVVKMVPRLQRAKKGYQVEIDYDRWLAKWDRANEGRQRKLYEGAKAMAKGRDAHEIATNPPAILLAELGPPPMPPRTFIEAMKAGNKWALGLDAVIPQKALALLSEIQTWIVTPTKKIGNAIGDPLADDDETQNLAEDAGFEAVTEIDPFGEVEEQHDPKATGGKVEKVRKPRKKTEVAVV